MRILLTNSLVDERASDDEMMVAVGRAFQARGHRVMAYSSDPREIERFVERDDIPICTRPGECPLPLGSIHATHHLHAITALMALPGVPAIYDCDPALASQPLPIHPRLRRYLVPSQELRETVLERTGLAPQHVRVALPRVDLRTFSIKRPAPAKPRNATFYNCLARDVDAVFPMAKQACRGLGIALDEQTRGRYVTFRFPYRELPAYDVVFARGQSALEALVCGCAVVLLADGACGPLVTPENLRALAAEHFLPSAEACAELSPLAITEQLQAIHQDRVGETCRIAREMFDLELACDDLLLWHKEVIEENRADPPPDLVRESAAVASYTNDLVAQFRATRREPHRHPATMQTMDVMGDCRSQLAKLRRQFKIMF